MCDGWRWQQKTSEQTNVSCFVGRLGNWPRFGVLLWHKKCGNSVGWTLWPAALQCAVQRACCISVPRPFSSTSPCVCVCAPFFFFFFSSWHVSVVAISVFSWNELLCSSRFSNLIRCFRCRWLSRPLVSTFLLGFSRPLHFPPFFLVSASAFCRARFTFLFFNALIV